MNNLRSGVGPQDLIRISGDSDENNVVATMKIPCNFPLVRFSIGEASVLILIDTGASVSVISENLVERLGLK